MIDFYLSNSMMNDWETLCPLVFKAKHIDKKIEFKSTEDMIWGQIFETLCIGSSVGGQIIVATDKQKASAYWPRVKHQAMEVIKYLRLLGGTVISRQQYYKCEITDNNGQVIKICGGYDIHYQMPDGTKIVIDIKLTGDTENDFGKFAWGSPEKMDLGQSIQYSLIHKIVFSEPCGFQYWVFDKGVDFKKKLIDVQISEVAEFHHIERLSQVYNEIMMAIQMDDWQPKNTFANCSTCPCPCKFRRIMPEMTTVNL